jgi:hypothetical protein
MASRSIDLSGLPPIQQGGGFDVDNILKIANLFQQQYEQEARFGTPGRPEVTSATKPFFAKSRGFQEVPGSPPLAPSVPLNAPLGSGRGDPSTGIMEEAQGRVLTSGIPGTPTSYVRPAVPGTPGTVEQELKVRLATAGLLDPESVTRRGFAKEDFKTKEIVHTVSVLEATLLKRMGIPGVEPGQTFDKEGWTSLKSLVSLNTSSRQADAQTLILQKLGYDVQSKAEDVKQKKALTELYKGLSARETYIQGVVQKGYTRKEAEKLADKEGL